VSDAAPSKATTPLTLGALVYEKAARSGRVESDWVQLIRQIEQGDQRALHALYDQANRIVFTLAMRITKDVQTAEELTVDVFHDVWRKAADYDPLRGPVLGWIMNQARSRAIDRLRFEQRKKRQGHEADVIQASPRVPDPQASFQIVERRSLLLRALDGLTPEERQVIEVSFFSELTHEQVAAKLDWPLGTVKTRIRSALQKLRKCGAELKGI
jgi:RNA polymerase sigma-70 factor, ECF subfamily